MTDIKDGGPAFDPDFGMTLRDYFAAQYEPTEEEVRKRADMWERHEDYWKPFSHADVRAALRYEEADAMIAQRDK